MHMLEQVEVKSLRKTLRPLGKGMLTVGTVDVGGAADMDEVDNTEAPIVGVTTIAVMVHTEEIEDEEAKARHRSNLQRRPERLLGSPE